MSGLIIKISDSYIKQPQMDVKGVTKGRPYRTPQFKALKVILGVVGFVLGLITAYTMYSSNQRAHTPEGLRSQLMHERERLEKRIATYQSEASGLGLPGLELLSSSSSSSSSKGEELGKGGAPHVTSVTTQGLGGGGGQCDPPDPDAKYRMQPADDIAKQYPELAGLLKQHAINNEIMLALANTVMICKNTTVCWWNGGNILESFLTILKHSNITNHLIGVMDEETAQYLTGREGVNWFRVNIPIPTSQKGSHPANQVSTIKYTLLKTFLQLGYHTLITDMDLVYISNPFNHFHRDADIEIQTDGFDDMSYGRLGGIHDPTMGWGGGGLYFETFTTNVGCMYTRATPRSFKLMVQVSDHLKAHPGWDQQIFNEYLMRPSHGDFQNSYAHLRVLDYSLWVNSKIFFRSKRREYLPGAKATAPTPILVHFNYHPDKHKRMLCIMDRYFYDKIDACDNFPGGSEPNT